MERKGTKRTKPAGTDQDTNSPSSSSRTTPEYRINYRLSWCSLSSLIFVSSVLLSLGSFLFGPAELLASTADRFLSDKELILRKFPGMSIILLEETGSGRDRQYFLKGSTQDGGGLYSVLAVRSGKVIQRIRVALPPREFERSAGDYLAGTAHLLITTVEAEGGISKRTYGFYRVGQAEREDPPPDFILPRVWRSDYRIVSDESILIWQESTFPVRGNLPPKRFQFYRIELEENKEIFGRLVFPIQSGTIYSDMNNKAYRSFERGDLKRAKSYLENANKVVSDSDETIVSNLFFINSYIQFLEDQRSMVRTGMLPGVFDEEKYLLFRGEYQTLVDTIKKKASIEELKRDDPKTKGLKDEDLSLLGLGLGYLEDFDGLFVVNEAIADRESKGRFGYYIELLRILTRGERKGYLPILDLMAKEKSTDPALLTNMARAYIAVGEVESGRRLLDFVTKDGRGPKEALLLSWQLRKTLGEDVDESEVEARLRAGELDDLGVLCDYYLFSGKSEYSPNSIEEVEIDGSEDGKDRNDS